MFLKKVVLKICSKFTGEHPYRSVISIKLQSNFIEITLRDGCCPVNLLRILRTPFLKITYERLLLLQAEELFSRTLLFSRTILSQKITCSIEKMGLVECPRAINMDNK